MADPTPDRPRVGPTELIKLTEPGDGFGLYGLTTEWPLEIVMQPGFFRGWGVTKVGFIRGDMIFALCKRDEDVHQRANLEVTRADRNSVDVVQLGKTEEYELKGLQWFERLEVRPVASAAEMEIAFRAKAKKLHPD